jgi:hypothetical protein
MHIGQTGLSGLSGSSTGGSGGSVYVPSLDFSDSRNSQYLL